MTAHTIQEMAVDALEWFEQFERKDGDKVWKTKDGRPEWILDLVGDAHDSRSILPDDYRYAFIVEALHDIASATDVEDMDPPEADIYTADLLAWLASRNDRVGYVDEAVEQWCLRDDVDTLARISAGQILEKEEVRASVLASLEARLEQEEDDSE
jgi:hypothetical protein